MADDIVTRLRIACRQEGAEYCGNCQPCEAADEIERLRNEVGVWRKIADRLIGGAEEQIDEWRPAGAHNTNESWMKAWKAYEEACHGV